MKKALMITGIILFGTMSLVPIGYAVIVYAELMENLFVGQINDKSRAVLLSLATLANSFTPFTLLGVGLLLNKCFGTGEFFSRGEQKFYLKLSGLLVLMFSTFHIMNGVAASGYALSGGFVPIIQNPILNSHFSPVLFGMLMFQLFAAAYQCVHVIWFSLMRKREFEYRVRKFAIRSIVFSALLAIGSIALPILYDNLEMYWSCFLPLMIVYACMIVISISLLCPGKIASLFRRKKKAIELTETEETNPDVAE